MDVSVRKLAPILHHALTVELVDARRALCGRRRSGVHTGGTVFGRASQTGELLNEYRIEKEHRA